jgi:hypothetical protein
LELRSPFDPESRREGHRESARRDENIEERRHPRFKVEVDVRVYARGRTVVRGNSVDLSKSGIAVMLIDEIPTGEVVRIEFALPLGTVDTHALVCQRSAFRYGLQFVESATASDIIGQTCRQLALEQTLFASKFHPEPR